MAMNPRYQNMAPGMTQPMRPPVPAPPAQRPVMPQPGGMPQPGMMPMGGGFPSRAGYGPPPGPPVRPDRPDFPINRPDFGGAGRPGDFMRGREFRETYGMPLGQALRGYRQETPDFRMAGMGGIRGLMADPAFQAYLQSLPPPPPPGPEDDPIAHRLRMAEALEAGGRGPRDGWPPRQTRTF